uniref:PID domain-containing protein n=1 Tax=Macrostomum lignano TaxID=282301 RepID=A0A1I8JRF2_9PLAT
RKHFTLVANGSAPGDGFSPTRKEQFYAPVGLLLRGPVRWLASEMYQAIAAAAPRRGIGSGSGCTRSLFIHGKQATAVSAVFRPGSRRASKSWNVRVPGDASDLGPWPPSDAALSVLTHCESDADKFYLLCLMLRKTARQRTCLCAVESNDSLMFQEAAAAAVISICRLGLCSHDITAAMENFMATGNLNSQSLLLPAEHTGLVVPAGEQYQSAKICRPFSRRTSGRFFHRDANYRLGACYRRPGASSVRCTRQTSSSPERPDRASLTAEMCLRRLVPLNEASALSQDLQTCLPVLLDGVLCGPGARPAGCRAGQLAAAAKGHVHYQKSKLQSRDYRVDYQAVKFESRDYQSQVQISVIFMQAKFQSHDYQSQVMIIKPKPSHSSVTLIIVRVIIKAKSKFSHTSPPSVFRVRASPRLVCPEPWRLPCKRRAAPGSAGPYPGLYLFSDSARLLRPVSAIWSATAI